MRSKSSNVFAAISCTLGLSIQPQSWLHRMLKRLNSTMIHKSESWTPEDVVHDFDLNISLWCYIKPNKTDLVQNLHGPSFTKASTLSHPCTGSRPEVPELHPQNVWTQLYNWIHWDTSEGMIEWVSVLGSSTFLQTIFKHIFLARVGMPERKIAMIQTNATWSSPKRRGNTKQMHLQNNPSWVTALHKQLSQQHLDVSCRYVHILHLPIHFLPPWLQPRCTGSVGVNFIHLGQSRWWSDHAVTNPGVVELPRIEFRTSWRALRFSKIVASFRCTRDVLSSPRSFKTWSLQVLSKMIHWSVLKVKRM